MREAGDIIEAFDRLRNIYGRAVAPAVSPFSNWRPAAGAPIGDEVVREWEVWARSRTAHAEHCTQFCVKYNVTLDGDQLLDLVSRWGDSNNISGDNVRSVLEKHAAAINKLKGDHAASWVKEVEAKFTSS